MRQSFEEFLKNKYEHYRKGKKLVLYFDAWMSDLGIAGISQYAEEWSSQQPEGEVEVWCGCGDKLSKRSDGFYWCLGCDHGVEILAKHKERRAS